MLFHCFLASVIAVTGLPVICGLFFHVAFRIFPLFLVFFNFTKINPGVDFFLFILLGLCPAFCVCELMFPQFWKTPSLTLDVDFFRAVFYLFLGFIACSLEMFVQNLLQIVQR